MHATVDAVFDDPALRALVEDFVAELAPHGWSNALVGQAPAAHRARRPRCLPGLRAVGDLARRSRQPPSRSTSTNDDGCWRELDAGFADGALPAVDASGAAKLLVTSRALRLRRDRPELFTRYTPMTVVGAASDHAIAFDRGGALTVATRLPLGLQDRGGWGDTALLRHSGPTTDALTGRRFEGSTIALAELLATYPVALLVPPTREATT